MSFLTELVAAGVLLLSQNVDENAVRSLVSSYVDAREHENAQEIEALFATDADQLVSSGEWRRGRQEVVRGTLASSHATGGKRTITIVSLRFVTPDVAIVDGRYDLTGLAGGESRHMWTTLVVTRAADRWRISAIRNMLPAPAPKQEPRTTR
jgi:uncharacterized protein (TIGR02246 family)